MVQNKSQEDTYSYKGWMNSDFFLKRAFAVYGHMFVAGLLIAIPFYVFFFIIFLILDFFLI